MALSAGVEDGDGASDLQVPVLRPTDPNDLLDKLHETLVRLNTAWFAAVAAERAYERHRAQVINHHLASQSASTATTMARADTRVVDLHHNLVDARTDVTRLEGFAAHWRFLIEHTPTT